MASRLAEQTARLPQVPSTEALPRPATNGRRGSRPLPKKVQRRRAAVEQAPKGRRIAKPRLSSVPGWEWGIVVVALFVLGRTPVLFYRSRIREVFGLSPATGIHHFYIWQDDPALRFTFAAVLLVVYVIAARRCDPRSLIRQPFLLAFLAMTLASAAWSIEPTVSLWRAGLFIGTAAVGWYLGERYTTREIVGIVGASAAIGALVSLIAVFVWPHNAQVTNRAVGVWSGVYANRNLLALVMASGLLALPFLMASARPRMRILLVAVGGLELFLLFKSGSRTSLIGLGAAAAVGVPLVGVRRATTRALNPYWGAVAVSLVAGYVALLVQWNWGTIVRQLDRHPNLTRRTVMWAIDRYYAALHPWKGWGFEAIWAHPPTIGVAQTIYRAFPYSSHSGYYEILLGTGRIGLGLFVAFLGFAAWRTFRFAWEGRDAASIWPLCFVVFAAVVNFSESMFVSSEAVWALTVAAAVAATGSRSRRRALS